MPCLQTILCDLDLEDELDLLYTLSCDHEASPPQIYVNILDCHTLTLLKKQKLDFELPQRSNVYEYDVSLCVHYELIRIESPCLCLSRIRNSRYLNRFEGFSASCVTIVVIVSILLETIIDVTTASHLIL